MTQQFIVENKEDLYQSMKDLQFDVMDIRVLKQVLPIEKMLLPTLDLNSMTRISTEV